MVDENKDPNVANDQGHTNYPKWVEHPSDLVTSDSPNNKGEKVPKKVLVKNKAEEDKVLGKVKGWDTVAKKTKEEDA